MTNEQLMKALDLDTCIRRNLDWLKSRKQLLDKVSKHNGIYKILSIDDEHIQIEKVYLVSILEDQISDIEKTIDDQKEKFKNL
jgi:hypothetical protein